MSADAPIVVIVDDDPSVRRGLGRLLRSAGYRVDAFSSASDFLAHAGPERPQCLVLDVSMPGRSGPRLYRDLLAAGYDVPAVFVTGHGDRAIAAEAMEAGYEVLSKPFEEEALIAAIERAMATRGIG